MRERVLKVVMVVVGLAFVAGMYPLIAFFTKEPAVAMIMSLYVTLGVFLLVAARDPAANRSLIAFAGWANVAHAGVMAVQYSLHAIERQELGGVVLFGIVGVVLIAITPRKPTRELATVNVGAKAPAP
jgi:drug/metabolite transporter superfamily protein YnfA